MPLYFIKHIDKYEAGGAICFKGLNFTDVSIAVFSGRLDWLAEQIVQLRPDPLTHEQVQRFRYDSYTHHTNYICEKRIPLTALMTLMTLMTLVTLMTHGQVRLRLSASDGL